MILKEALLLNPVQDEQVLHGSKSSDGFSQFIALAKIRAHVVLPTPRGPQNKNA
jgi:hypothetical protein